MLTHTAIIFPKWVFSVYLLQSDSGVTPMSSTGLEPGAPRRLSFRGGGRGHPYLSCPGALFIQFLYSWYITCRSGRRTPEVEAKKGKEQIYIRHITDRSIRKGNLVLGNVSTGFLHS